MSTISTKLSLLKSMLADWDRTAKLVWDTEVRTDGSMVIRAYDPDLYPLVKDVIHEAQGGRHNFDNLSFKVESNIKLLLIPIDKNVTIPNLLFELSGPYETIMDMVLNKNFRIKI